MKTLFICKHNRFRNKVAEGIFNKLSKNNKAKSAGLILDKLRPYICKNVLDVMKDKGYKIKSVSRVLNKKKLNDYDLIVIVADNVDKKSFVGFNGKIIKWKIPDCSEFDLEKIKKIVEGIEKKVKRLVEKF